MGVGCEVGEQQCKQTGQFVSIDCSEGRAATVIVDRPRTVVANPGGEGTEDRDGSDVGCVNELRPSPGRPLLSGRFTNSWQLHLYENIVALT